MEKIWSYGRMDSQNELASVRAISAMKGAGPMNCRRRRTTLQGIGRLVREHV